MASAVLSPDAGIYLCRSTPRSERFSELPASQNKCRVVGVSRDRESHIPFELNGCTVFALLDRLELYEGPRLQHILLYRRAAPS